MTLHVVWQVVTGVLEEIAVSILRIVSPCGSVVVRALCYKLEGRGFETC
jgi:hypothetical protein